MLNFSLSLAFLIFCETCFAELTNKTQLQRYGTYGYLSHPKKNHTVCRCQGCWGYLSRPMLLISILFFEISGMETDSAYEQKLMPDGKLNIDGYICCFDVSRVEQRSLEHQVDFVSHLLTGAIKTKKPVVLVTTKNDEADERYVKEAEKLASRRENKTNIPLIGTSAHENVNVEQAFMVLAHMIDKSKTRPKITAVHEAFKQRREILDVATEAYKSLLRTNVQDPKATWNITRKKLEKESDFGHYVDLFGSDSAKKLFRQHTKYLRDEQIRMREQHFIKRLPDVLQHFLPDLPTIADRYDCFSKEKLVY